MTDRKYLGCGERIIRDLPLNTRKFRHRKNTFSLLTNTNNVKHPMRVCKTNILTSYFIKAFPFEQYLLIKIYRYVSRIKFISSTYERMLCNSKRKSVIFRGYCYVYKNSYISSTSRQSPGKDRIIHVILRT